MKVTVHRTYTISESELKKKLGIEGDIVNAKMANQIGGLGALFGNPNVEIETRIETEYPVDIIKEQKAKKK